MVQREIANGPSKYDLMLALFDGDKDHRRLVTFEIKRESRVWEAPVTVLVNEVSRMDDSGEVWLFRGITPWRPEPFAIDGSFSTQTRLGWLRFLNVTGEDVP